MTIVRRLMGASCDGPSMASGGKYRTVVCYFT